MVIPDFYEFIKFGVLRLMGTTTEEKAENGISVAKNIDSTSVDRKELNPEGKRSIKTRRTSKIAVTLWNYTKRA
jgi:hypothetical protein